MYGHAPILLMIAESTYSPRRQHRSAWRAVAGSVEHKVAIRIALDKIILPAEF